MKTYARIHNGRVVELLTTSANPAALYHASLLWIDISDNPGVALGWEYDGSRFAATNLVHAGPVLASLDELQAHLAMLGAQIAALRKPE